MSSGLKTQHSVKTKTEPLIVFNRVSLTILQIHIFRLFNFYSFKFGKQLLNCVRIF